MTTEFSQSQAADIEKNRLAYLRGRKPLFLLPLPGSTQTRLRALKLFAQGRLEAGLELLDEANGSGDSFEGTVDGREVQGWRDEDDFLGDILEVVVADKLHWLPFVQIESLRLAEQGQLQSLYLPVEIRLINQEQVSGWLPIRYVQSETHPEKEIQAAEEVDLYSDEAGCTRCLGLRHWLIGLDAFTPWEFRQLERRSERIGLM
ncbi:hypothetical protein KIH39_23315 [Telmatocola sphagniphila]|uniref:Uncharacterized protein n=1 Tax=Telmatocola sphagniphila TaxID=1123043 RepID=A0A8E6B4G2_9BACT|nr:type VI secretion system accessory protein TagJ [Telmatocola sphagniphila]QVL31737.1 hypothetical protein KIH39_23315 [Telmatocola sphagniphila]